MEALEGRVVVITGAHGGRGREFGGSIRGSSRLVGPVDLEGDDVFRADVSTPEGNSR